MVTYGKAYVKVTSRKGNININDPITTSTNPGVGEKALDSGYILGNALQAYSSNNPNTVGMIIVELNPRYNSLNNTSGKNLIQSFSIAANAPFLSPLTSLRYLLAVLISAFAFGFGFFYFGNISKHSMDALGRNPLAARSIERGLVLNIILAVGIIVGGIYLSYIILSL